MAQFNHGNLTPGDLEVIRQRLVDQAIDAYEKGKTVHMQVCFQSLGLTVPQMLAVARMRAAWQRQVGAVRG